MLCNLKLSILIGTIFLIIQLTVTTSLGKLCQSGLREDNTNYIYCSRQSLTKIPSFFSDITPNVFYDELVLSDNLIDRVDQNSFGTMLKVRKLYLDQNPIRVIHDRAFEHIRNYLEDLYFDQKILNQPRASTTTDDSLIFENSIFQMCFNLHLLSIKNYHITHLKPFQFLRMSKLQQLVLSNNKLSHISDNAFKGLEKTLVDLNLDSNFLELVPSKAIQGLQSLTTLSLSQNRIKTLHANTFLVLANMRSLDLSYNLLNKLERSAFDGPAQWTLANLHLQNNGLKWQTLIDLMSKLYSLQELNLDFNKLARPKRTVQYYLENAATLNASVIKLNLKSLSLQGNSLKSQDLQMLAEPFKNQDYANFQMRLKYSYRMMDYGDARTEELGKYQRFSYPKLRRLNLARNKITKLPRNFFTTANMSKLEWLTMDRNPLESNRISGDYFSGIENSLTTLSMNNVGFNVWSPHSIESLMRLTKLESLKLNGNTQKEESLSVNTLKLELNNKNEHTRLASLTSLELQNNNLKHLPSFICNLNSLESLDLSSNSLSTLDLNCLKKGQKQLAQLNQLNLNNNPLKCDCKLRDLKVWLMSTYDKDLLDLIMWECSNLNGRYLVNVDLHEMTCQEKYLHVSAAPIQETTTTVTTTTPRITTTTTMNSTSTATDAPVYVANTDSVLIAITTASIVATNTEVSKLTVEASRVNRNQKQIEMSYYTLVIGLSLGISAICLVILVFFYANCMRQHHSSIYKGNSPFITHTNSKYEPKFCSPNSSTASSNATTTTLAISRHQNIMISSDDSLSRDSSLTHSSELLLKHKCQNNDMPHFYHNFYDTIHNNKTSINQQCNCNNNSKMDIFQCRNDQGYFIETPMNASSRNDTRQNVFSITSNNTNGRKHGIEPAPGETHIYHEINTPVKFTSNFPQSQSRIRFHGSGECFIDKKFVINNPVNNNNRMNIVSQQSSEQSRQNNQYLVNGSGNGMIV